MSSDTQLQTIESLKQDLTQRDLEIRALRLANEKMKVELTHLRRMRYGRSSEKMDAAQSQLELLSAALAPVVLVSALSDDTNSDVSKLDRTSLRCWTMNPAASKSFATSARSLPALNATRLPRRQHRAVRLIVAWPAPV